MSDKIYYPETIEDRIFPNGSGGNMQGGYIVPEGANFRREVKRDPKKSLAEQFPQRILAHRLMSESFNTQTRQILGDFTFGQSGALRIGEYDFGNSGDLRLTPNGLTARNVNGETTVAIDGTTGEATFKGTVQAGSLISDTEVNVADNFIVDADGNVIANSIALADTLNVSSVSGLSQIITSTSTETDITGSSITFDLPRATNVIINYGWSGWIMRNSGSGSFGATGDIRLYTGSTERHLSMISGEYDSGSTDRSGQLHLTTAGGFYLGSLPSGSNTVKLRGKLGSSSFNGALRIWLFYISIITIGSTFE